MLHSSPEAQGIPSAAITSFAAAADAQLESLHGFMLLRHGHVVAQGSWHPYSADRPHMMFSVSKSFTATAIGLAVAEGLLSLDDPVVSFFPSGAPAEMRVKHLLTMTTGHAKEVFAQMTEREDGDWVKGFLETPLEHAPGTHFVYNSGASYLLSAILQRLTGMTMLDYLRPRLLEPLGIEDATWDTCPQGVNTGGWGLNLRLAEVARFGQLYLDDGVWNGRRLLPIGWCEAASSAQVDNDNRDAPIDWRQGYGYQFWRCRHGAYRADGAFGQFCLVMPQQDAVLVTTGGMPDMQPLLELVWTHLLPAMGDSPLSANASSDLRDQLAGLSLPPLPAAQGLAGVDGRTYRLVPPERGELSALDSIKLTKRDDGWTVTLGGEHDFACRDGQWEITATSFGLSQPVPIAVTGAWVASDTFELRAAYVETAFVRSLSCRFEGEGVTVTFRENVSFGPTEHPPLVGSAVTA